MKGEKVGEYNLWVDYVEGVEVVDSWGGGDIEWGRGGGKVASE